MVITLYYAPVTCAMVTWIVLNEVKAEFETINLNFKMKEHRKPEYLNINPFHKVPTLIVDGKMLSENIAIIQWINSNFPQKKVLPIDRWDYFKAISLLSWCSSGIHPYLTRINNPKKVIGKSNNSNFVVQLATNEISECLGVADNILKKNEFFFNNFTAVDVHFFWCCRRARQFGIKLDDFGNVQRHFDSIRLRESVTKLFSYEASVLEKFKTETP